MAMPYHETDTDPTENLASHRMQQLLGILPFALQYGAVEVEPEFEPLKVYISSVIMLKN